MANLRDVAKAVEARSKQKHARGSIRLPLPIYNGQYAARFGVTDPDSLKAFQERVEGEDLTPVEITDLHAQFVADACRQILAKNDAGKWEPLTHDDGRPVRFDLDFAEALSLEVDGGPITKDMGMADVVRAVWTVEDEDGNQQVNLGALNVFSINLVGWASDTSQKVAGEIAGESPARTR